MSMSNSEETPQTEPCQIQASGLSGEADKSLPPTVGDPETANTETSPVDHVAVRRAAVVRQVERHVGPIDFVLKSQEQSDQHGGAAEILVVKAGAEWPFHTLVTLGMVDFPMDAPKEEWQFAELCLLLPPDWSLEPDMDLAQESQWPIRWLQRMTRVPQESLGWLGYGHTVPNGEPPQPFVADTPFVSWLLLPPVSLPQTFARLRLPDETVLNFWALLPLHQDETYLKINKGTPALIELMGVKGVSDIFDAGRKSVFKRGGTTLKRWLFRI